MHADTTSDDLDVVDVDRAVTADRIDPSDSVPEGDLEISQPPDAGDLPVDRYSNREHLIISDHTGRAELVS